jgi:hypothetical protein
MYRSWKNMGERKPPIFLPSDGWARKPGRGVRGVEQSWWEEYAPCSSALIELEKICFLLRDGPSQHSIACSSTKSHSQLPPPPPLSLYLGAFLRSPRQRKLEFHFQVIGQKCPPWQGPSAWASRVPRWRWRGRLRGGQCRPRHPLLTS